MRFPWSKERLEGQRAREGRGMAYLSDGEDDLECMVVYAARGDGSENGGRVRALGEMGAYAGAHSGGRAECARRGGFGEGGVQQCIELL